MEKVISFRDIKLPYLTEGKGQVIVFLHGYLESGEIWDPFYRRFTGNRKVIIPDLPGHGKSGTWGEIHRMEELAEAVVAVLDAEHAGRACVLGHSMGGYVAMAFAAAFPQRLSGLGLIHSTCFADSEEKKLNRDREIALVKCGKKQQIISVNIPRAFSDTHLESFASEIDRAKQIALKTPDEGMIALLNGMKVRPDHSAVLAALKVPLMLVGGARDNYIPEAVFSRLSELNRDGKVVRLPESGHMGFVEEPETLYRELEQFLKECQ
ncbi:MAG: alpha/beta fold hydrolase [Bacteroidota bacterium]